MERQFIDIREKKTTNEPINIRGMFENMDSMGFNNHDCMCEKIDNSIQENATEIQIIIDKKNNLIIISDNGNGMNEEQLKICGTLHSRTESSKDKHGRFGAGGNIADMNLTNLGIAHYISRPNDGTEDIKEMKISYNVQEIKDYVLHPHDASKKTCNLWDKYAIDKNGSGTVQILYSYPKKIQEIMNSIENNNIDETYRFHFGRMYNKQLKNGLKFEIRIEDRVYIISPIDLFKYDIIKTEDKDTSKILVWFDNGSYTFYYKFDNNNLLYYRDYSKSTKGKEVVMKNPPTGTYIGEINVESSYNSEWGVLIKPELNIMKIDSTKITKDKFRATIGGIIVERNDKQITQFPSCETTGVCSSLIPFYQGSHHNINFKANESLDCLFGVLVNKSHLERKNINDTLNKTIKHLCDSFVSKMNKLYGKKSKTEICESTTTDPDDQDEPTTATAPVQPTKVTAPIQPTTTAPIQPTTTAPVQPTKVTAPVQPTSSAQVNPINPLKPIVPLSPPSNIKMSKSENELIVTYKEKIIANIPYVGQYGITEKYYSAILTELGDERFAELINNDKKKGHFEDHRQFYFK
jgi:hypothetical protein